MLLLVGTGTIRAQEGPIQKPAASDFAPKAIAPPDLPPPDWVRDSNADLQILPGLAPEIYRYKAENWTPVIVRVFNHTSSPMSGWLRVGSGDGFEFETGRATYDLEARVEPLSYRTFRVGVNPGPGDGMLLARFEDKVRGALLAPPAMAAGSQMLRDEEAHVLVLGSEPIDQRYGSHLFLIADRQNYAMVVSYPRSIQLPVEPAGYHGVDLMFVNGSPALSRLSAEQSDALTRAVQDGLQIVLECTYPGDLPVFLEFVRRFDRGVSGSYEVNQLLTKAMNERIMWASHRDRMVSAFLAAEQPQLSTWWSNPRPVLVDDPSGFVLPDPASAGLRGRPLQGAVFPHGKGRITLLTFSLAAINKAERSSSEQLTRWFVPRSKHEVARDVHQRHALDEAALLALARFEGSRIPSHWKILTFFVLYALMLGPGSWMLARRGRSVMGAWSFHIPLVVLAFSLISYWSLRPVRLEKPLVRSFKHVAAGASGREGTALTYLSLYSPAAADYRATLAGGCRLVPLDRRDHRGLGQQSLRYRGPSTVEFPSFAYATTNLRLTATEPVELAGTLNSRSGGPTEQASVQVRGLPPAAAGALFAGPIEGRFYRLEPAAIEQRIDMSKPVSHTEIANSQLGADPTQRDVLETVLRRLIEAREPHLLAFSGPDKDDVTFVPTSGLPADTIFDLQGVTLVTSPLSTAQGALPR